MKIHAIILEDNIMNVIRTLTLIYAKNRRYEYHIEDEEEEEEEEEREDPYIPGCRK